VTVQRSSWRRASPYPVMLRSKGDLGQSGADRDT
jgi:hypothetical protein